MSSPSSAESIGSGGISSQGQKPDYQRGQEHTALRSQHPSRPQEAGGEGGGNCELQTPDPLNKRFGIHVRAAVPMSGNGG